MRRRHPNPPSLGRRLGRRCLSAKESRACCGAARRARPCRACSLHVERNRARPRRGINPPSPMTAEFARNVAPLAPKMCAPGSAEASNRCRPRVAPSSRALPRRRTGARPRARPQPRARPRPRTRRRARLQPRFAPRLQPRVRAHPRHRASRRIRGNPRTRAPMRPRPHAPGARGRVVARRLRRLP